jgi:glucans biosynthesis protein
MHESPRCGARTRAGTPCRAPAVKAKRRCRLHGGAKRSGAQPGNTNALKHGFYAAAAEAERRRLRALIRAWRKGPAGLE